jgi:hypothetical protein
MVHISEELEAAKAAKAAIDFLLTTSPKPVVVATLNKAKYAAVLNLSSGGALNEARISVGIALSNVIHGMPTQEKIDKAKRTIETWIREFIASGVNVMALIAQIALGVIIGGLTIALLVTGLRCSAVLAPGGGT